MAMYGTGTAPKTELLINGTWTDFSSRPRGAQAISIVRGRVNEQSSVSAQTCQMTLDNTDGQLSNRNPNSPYFGLLPRNTQVRVTAGAGDNYLKAVYSDQGVVLNNVQTSDKAVLDITGDIDIRCDILPYTWHTGIASNNAEQGMTIATKGSTSTQLSWAFYMLGDGTLRLRWYPAGITSGQLTATSTVPVPPASGRLTVRVTLDVNNGAGGNTVTFYTSNSVTGTFTQLGATVTQSGTTSIFNSSAALVVAGGGDGTPTFFTTFPAYGGRFYRFQMYNGIGGTLVADMNATARNIGDTSWSDGLSTPNTWTINGSNRITSDRIRFWGELSALPQSWDLSGTDVTAPVTAAGLIRRLTQGAQPIDSPMVRNFSRYSPAGYWSLEDGRDSTSASSQVNGGKSGTATLVSFGNSSDGIPGAVSVAQFTDATSALSFTAGKMASTGTVSHVFYFNVSALPSSQKVVARLYCSGNIRTVRVSLNATQWITEFVGADGTVFATSTVAVTGIDPSKGWIGFNVLLQQSALDVNYSIRWDNVGVTAVGVGPTLITSATCGVPVGALFTATDTVLTSAKYSSVFMSTGNFDLTDDNFRNASNAWLGETAAARLTRLVAENGVPVEVWGIRADSETMGYQLIDTFMNNVYDCADTDGGMLGECRDLLSLFYRTRTSLESRTDVSLSYTSSHLQAVPEPTEDDQAFTNDVTVTRQNGGSARAVNTDGPTSISDPPNGVGRYTTAVTRNASDEDRLPSIAGWEMLTGSWDEARYPNLTVGMHRSEIQNNSTLAVQLTGLEIGDTAKLSGLPSWMPPDDVYELIQGYQETLDHFLWTIVLNCTPAGPYVNAAFAGGSTFSVARADGNLNTLNSSLTTTATSISLATPAGSALWVTTAANPAEFPFNIKVAGEVMTVTAITGTSSPQTGTVTRSVNGIVKAHSAGESVRLATEYYVGS